MKEETNKIVNKHISITKKCGIWWIFEENEHGKQISDGKGIDNKTKKNDLMNGSLVQENLVKISSIREWIIHEDIRTQSNFNRLAVRNIVMESESRYHNIDSQ